MRGGTAGARSMRPTMTNHVVVARRKHNLVEAEFENPEHLFQHVKLVAHVTRTEAHIESAIYSFGKLRPNPI